MHQTIITQTVIWTTAKKHALAHATHTQAQNHLHSPTVPNTHLNDKQSVMNRQPVGAGPELHGAWSILQQYH